MLQQVGEEIRRYGMLQPGDSVVVAVSGGPDSVALLHVLHSLAKEYALGLQVFHMDHGLRGESSTADARYVESLAASLELPVTVVALPPGQLKDQPGSVQSNARRIRYQELEALARRVGACRIALGHNREDQAETVLMRFLRGTGTRGLAGIPQIRVQHDLTYIRPLLGISRATIEEYCREQALTPRIDPSNLKAEYLRNRIRLELLPQLSRDYNPALVENLAVMATTLRAEDDLLDSLAAQALAESLDTASGLVLQGTVLLSVDRAIARRVIRLAARRVAGEDFDLGFEAVERVIAAAAQSQGTRTFHLPGGLTVLSEYGQIRFLRSASAPENQVDLGVWSVSPHGETTVPEFGLRVIAGCELGEPDPSALMEVVLDRDRLPGPLLFRARRPGDRVWPVGMEGSKKLQDILVDSKVPLRQRDRVPVLVAGDQAIWVVGHRLDRRFLASPGTRNPLVLRIFPL